MLQKLIRLFIRTNGRKPNNLEMILLKRKAMNQAIDEKKVIEFPRDRITDWTKDRPTIGKKADVVSSGISRKTEKLGVEDMSRAEKDEIFNNWLVGADQTYYKFVNETLVKVQNAGKGERLQIAKEIINRKGMYRHLDDQDAAKILKSIDQNIKPVEPKAYGGIAGMLGEPTYSDDNHRVPYKDGSKMSRRGFLKILGGLATIPLVGKYFKWAKPLAKSSKVLTSVPIKNIDGMPLWFKPLVNKVIKEGDDVSKKFATAEREIVHKTKLPDSQTDVIVTQNLDSGNVSVELGMTKHGFRDGHLGQPVRLEYKASELIEPPIVKEGKVVGHGKGSKTKEEFWVEEAEFSGGHPENVKFEESSFEKFGEHGSNFDEVEMFATGKIKKKTGKAKIKAEREHWVDDRAPEADDFASGGRVPFFKGKIAKGILSLGKKKKKKLTADDVSQDHPLRRKEFEEELFGTKEQQESKKFKEKIIKKLEQYHKLKYMDTKGKKGHAFGGRVPLAGGAIVKGGKWFIKSLTDTRKQLKTMRLSPGQLKQYLDQIDDQIRRIKAGEKIPDEIIQTIRKDPKFKSVWQNQKSADPELREMEEVLLEYGQKHASGGLAGMLGE